jgi:peptidoglycan/LPS O-acetylase OafA/YrhL
MIGAWRLMLAMLVVCAHLFTPWWPGAMAVFAFYVISGFLMTLILQEQYSFSWAGLRAFWINRVLRIYPPYYFACLASILLILAWPPEAVTSLNAHLSIPDTPGEILTNTFIVGLIDWPEDRSSLVVPGWTLFIELVHYLVISLWAGRSRKTAFIFLALSIAYVAATYLFLEGNFGFRYLIPPAGSFPFAVGVLLYFYKEPIGRLIAAVGWKLAFGVSAALYSAVFVAASLAAEPLGACLYVNVLTSALLLIVLWHSPASSLRRVDKMLGDLSYPTYLLHWQAGALVVLTTGYALKSVEAFALSIFAVIAFALLERRLVSGPMERWRTVVKRRAGNAASAPAGSMA